MKIQELHIYTTRLQEQIEFYAETIGLKVLHTSDTMARFQIGSSVLTIEVSNESTPYHFAINIPSNQGQEALEWLQQRVPILKDGAVEIQDFDFWNAKAIYFYDRDQNIVEFIARKNRNRNSSLAFTVDSLLEISEIGVPVENIKHIYNQLRNISKISIYDGGFERFLAIGDEHGLFICINTERKDWFPTNDTAHASPFKLWFAANGSDHAIQFKNKQITSLERN